MENQVRTNMFNSNDPTIYHHNSYQFYSEFLSKGKNKQDRPIANNTRVIRQKDYIAIKLHDTEIVKFYSKGLVELNSGGWRTVITKDRMNNFSPISIYTRNHVWFVQFRNKEYFYEDGITFDLETGKVSSIDDHYLKPYNEKQLKSKNQMVRKIQEYARNCAKAYIEGKLPTNSGDCFMCLAQSSSIECIKSHIKEKYYMKSMVFNSFLEFPNSLSVVDQHNCYCIDNGKRDELRGALDMTERRIRRNITRYIHKIMGFKVS